MPRALPIPPADVPSRDAHSPLPQDRAPHPQDNAIMVSSSPEAAGVETDGDMDDEFLPDEEDEEDEEAVVEELASTARGTNTAVSRPGGEAYISDEERLEHRSNARLGRYCMYEFGDLVHLLFHRTAPLSRLDNVLSPGTSRSAYALVSLLYLC
jgi:hypothetical protein